MNSLRYMIALAVSAVVLSACNSSSQPRAADSSRDTVAFPPHSLRANEKAVEEPNFKRYFDEAGAHGTFVLRNPRSSIVECYNCERADSSFTPASTFKIFSSLVALETGAVKTEHDTLPWSGTTYRNTSWNKSQDMREAFKNSTVWFYQELARRIGRENMQHYIDSADYGNRDISGPIDMFWLTGNMRISPWHQIRLLERLHNGDLPFSQRTMDIVKDIMINEQAGDAILRAKTGTSMEDTGICWWVGYVEKGDDVWYFAINIDMKDETDMQKRKTIVRRILASRGIFPQSE